jgi:hypothetical protein
MNKKAILRKQALMEKLLDTWELKRVNMTEFTKAADVVLRLFDQIDQIYYSDKCKEYANSEKE